jgi:hypothetical protein
MQKVDMPLPSEQLDTQTKNIGLEPRDLINLGTWLLEEEISGMNLALVVDFLASPEHRDMAAKL